MVRHERRCREILQPGEAASDATIKVGIEDGTQLAALLDALCEPQPSSAEGAIQATSVPEQVIENTFVDPGQLGAAHGQEGE